MKKGKCCLLVEDDPEDQQFFVDALHDVSSTTGCYAASNGEDALSRLLMDEVNPDYIFTDLHMPGMDGIEFLKTLKKIETLRNIPVVILSSDCSEEQIQSAKHHGAIAYYSKTRFGILKEILKKYFADPGTQPSIL